MKPARARAPRQRAPAPRALQYKVVELSTVDEGSLESTVNEWARRGWTFDGVQFAMRESSKRPAMAFVFFTRLGEVVESGEPEPSPSRSAPARTATPQSAWDRLRRLAGDDEL